MIRLLPTSLCIGTVVLILAGLAAAQRPGSGVGTQPSGPVPPVPANVDVPGVPGQSAEDARTPGGVGVTPAGPGALKDPTHPSQKMRDALNAKANTKTNNKMKITPLSLRARIIARGKPPAALLEIEGKIYTVGKGSVVTGANNTMLRVLEINSTEVRIESSPGKEILSLR
jgi:hypothetical protein